MNNNVRLVFNLAGTLSRPQCSCVQMLKEMIKISPIIMSDVRHSRVTVVVIWLLVKYLDQSV